MEFGSPENGVRKRSNFSHDCREPSDRNEFSPYWLAFVFSLFSDRRDVSALQFSVLALISFRTMEHFSRHVERESVFGLRRLAVKVTNAMKKKFP